MGVPAAPVNPKALRLDFWLARLSVLAIIGLYLTLPGRLVLGPRWLLPALELAVLWPLSLTGIPSVARRLRARLGADHDLHQRALAVVLLALVNIQNGISAGLLAHRLVTGIGPHLAGRTLVDAALSIWLTNVFAFALWFWELDRGGPIKRRRGDTEPPDFLFPQMTAPQFAPAAWQPAYLDYLYVAVTNSAAFSPTDSMPLSRTAKALMTAQSIVALITVVVVAARAINIL